MGWSTLAAELPGSSDGIERLTDAGVVVAVGHTDATYEQTTQAIELGATVGTHVFNAMRPLHHRDPGPALALLEDPRVTVELIADGVHVHPALVRCGVIETAGPGRVALISDAMAAAGLPDGSFRLGTLEVDVVGRRFAPARNVDHRRQHREHGSAFSAPQSDSLARRRMGRWPPPCR